MFRFSALVVATSTVLLMGEAAFVPGSVARFSFATRGLGALVLRQTSTAPAPPPACAATCNVISPVVSAGCTASTCCQTSFVNNYFSCFECLGQVNNLTDYTTLQQTIDDVVEACSALGISLPKVTFPGQNPNRQLTTIAAGSTGGSFPTSSPPGLPISTGPPATSLNTSSSVGSSITPGIPPQTVITTLPSPTPTAPQITVSTLPTDTSTPGPSPTASFAVPTLSMQIRGLWLVSSTLVIASLFSSQWAL